MLPIEWRRAMAISQADAAKLLGISGKNPASTWRRYEIGERQPRMSLVVEVERLSKGRVTSRCWAEVREGYLAHQLSARSSLKDGLERQASA